MDAADAAEDASAQLVVAMQRQAMAQRRSRKEAVKQQARACAEQAWDDWAMHVELQSDQSRTRTRKRTFVVQDEVRDVGTQTGDEVLPSATSGACSSGDPWQSRPVTASNRALERKPVNVETLEQRAGKVILAALRMPPLGQLGDMLRESLRVLLSWGLPLLWGTGDSGSSACCCRSA